MQEIQAGISRNNINLKKIYKGNVYNSNKFLSKQLSIENEGNLDLNYEIIAPEVVHCRMNMNPIKG